MTHDEQRERRKQIAAFVSAGATWAEAARQFSVSVQTVYNACGRLRIANKDHIRHRNDRIVQSLTNGGTVSEVAERFGVTAASIYSICRKRGIVMKDVSGKRRLSLYSVVAMLQNTRKPISKIATEFGCSRQNIYGIYNRSRQAGIRIAGRS